MPTETPSSGLPCLCCRRQLQPSEAKIFAEVFCCPDCFLIAARLEERITAEMRRLQLLVREKIRTDLLHGRLQPSAQSPEGPSKTDILRAVVSLTETHHASCHSPSPGYSPDQPKGSRTRGDVRRLGS